MKGQIFGPGDKHSLSEDRNFVDGVWPPGNLIFVSHRHDDLDEAEKVARCIASCGLEAYLDEQDPSVQQDGPGLIDYLLEIIHKSSGLIVVASAKTKESWWVPGEIFSAHDNGSLIGTYQLPSVSIDELPSYLKYDWPVMENHEGLQDWCDKFKGAKGTQLAFQTMRIGNTVLESRRQAVDKIYDSFVDGRNGIRIMRKQ